MNESYFFVAFGSAWFGGALVMLSILTTRTEQHSFAAWQTVMLAVFWPWTLSQAMKQSIIDRYGDDGAE